MKHKIWYDEENSVLREEFHGDLLKNELHKYYEEVRKQFEGKPRRYSILDASGTKPHFPDKETRKQMGEEIANVKYDKIAIAGINPVMRMIVKTVVAMVRKKKEDTHAEIGFFPNTEEALAWLKGDA